MCLFKAKKSGRSRVDDAPFRPKPPPPLKKLPKEIVARRHLDRAHQLLNEAIGEIYQSGMTLELMKVVDLSELRHIEDIVWQYATETLKDDAHRSRLER